MQFASTLMIQLAFRKVEAARSDSRDGSPQHSESDVERSGATSNAPIASIEDLVCFWSTETFRSWSNYAGSFNQQLSFHRGVPSRLATALHHSDEPCKVLEIQVVRSEAIEDSSFTFEIYSDRKPFDSCSFSYK